MLNIKRLRIHYLAVFLLGHINSSRTQLLIHFLVKDFLVVLTICLNASIGNYILHDLVSIVVKDDMCVILVVAHFGQPET
jgi:hypothetical protein